METPQDVEPREMEHLLQFIYLGEVDIPSAELERLIAISKDLGIVGLDAVVKKGEECVVGERRRMPQVVKRKAQPTLKSQDQESMTAKLAKVADEDIVPIYYDDKFDADQQDLFDQYLDTHRDKKRVLSPDLKVGLC